jgi:hypothetical protein
LKNKRRKKDKVFSPMIVDLRRFPLFQMTLIEIHDEFSKFLLEGLLINIPFFSNIKIA